MQTLPKMIKDGPMKASAWNSLVDYLRQVQILPSSTVLPTISSTGTILNVRPVVQGPSVANPLHPFQLIEATGENEEAHYVRVLYGTVNGEVPTGMSVADTPPYVLELTEAQGIVYLGATIDSENFVINSLWIDQDATLPEETEFETYLEIGSYALTDGVLTLAQAVTTSLAYIRAGYNNLWGAA